MRLFFKNDPLENPYDELTPEEISISQSDITETLFRKNEIRSNRLACKILGVIGVLFCFLASLGLLDIYDMGNEFSCWLFWLAGAVLFSAYLIGRYHDYKPIWVKNLVLTTVLISSSVVHFLYPLNNSYLLYGPVIISAVYYNRKLVHVTTLINWLLYAISLWANVLLSNVPVLSELHEIQKATIWKTPTDVLLDFFLPDSVLFFLTAFVADNIAFRGRKMVLTRARISAEITNLEAELNAAAEIQRSSLPQDKLVGNQVIQAYMRPAKTVGGDFYDYFISDKGHLVFLVADVSDKGLPAAMFMMKAKSAVRNAIFSGEALEEAVAMANLMLCRENPENVFVTLWIGCINTETGLGKYANCGHLPPLVRHGNGQVDILENDPDPFLGVFENITIHTYPLRLCEDDTLLVFTDGLTDALNIQGQDFGIEGVRKALISLTDRNVNPCEEIVKAADDFARGTEQFDDMTLVSVRAEKTVAPFQKEMHFVSEFSVIGYVTEELNGLLESEKVPEDVRRMVDVVLDELLVNIASYAYPNQAGPVDLRLQIGKNALELWLEDHGIPFDPLTVQAPVFGDEPAIGGLGLFLVKNIVDTMDYQRKDTRNCLHLLKIWGI